MANIISQQIPHDSEAEKAVLGAIFLDNSAIVDAYDILKPDDFYERANKLAVGLQLLVIVSPTRVSRTDLILAVI